MSRSGKRTECAFCGKPFERKARSRGGSRQKYCSKECRLYANGRITRRKKVQPIIPALSLSQVALLSRDAGLSYGKYVQKFQLS